MGCPEGKIPSSLGSQVPAYQQSSGADRIFVDLKVNNGRWLISAYLNCFYYIFCAGKRFPKSDRIDVKQANFKRSEFRCQNTVPNTFKKKFSVSPAHYKEVI